MSVSTILTSKRIISAIVCSLSIAAMAATPVAVWDGDFGTSEKIGTDGKTYTLTLPSGADSWVQSDGTLKIGSGNQSAYINLQVGSDYNLAQGTKISVLMEYTNAVAQTGAAPIYLQADAYFGLKTKDSSLDVVGDWWGVTYPTTGDVVTTMPSDGCILMVYPQGGGAVQVYSATTRTGLSDASAGGNITGLAFSNKYLQKIGIGGTFTDGSAKNLKNFENLVIKKVAVFTSAITATDAAAYYFPSEIQTINVDSATTVSAINAQFDSANYKVADVTVANGVMITVNEAFSANIRSVSSAGTITLSATSQPDASYLSHVDFSGVQGGLLRSWLTPGVIGFNFNADGYRSDNTNTTVDACSDTELALEIGIWLKNARDASGTSTDLFADGLSTLTWTSANLYAERWNISSGTFIQGYLDDGNGGTKITLSNVPYATYDVIIYCSTDNSTKSFKAKTVNGTVYKWDSATGQTVVASGVNETWGLASTAAGKAVYGANTLRINGLSGPLSIMGGTNSDNARGCISAIQIMPAGTSTAPEMTVGTAGQTTQATWTGANWNVATAPTSGNVIINLSGDVELTVDEAVALSAITVNGEGTLKFILDQANSVTFTASSISSAVPLVFANDGIGIDTISASVTYLYRTPSINSLTLGSTYMAGAGSQETSVAIGHNGGSAVLDGTAGDTYYLQESTSATATTVMFTNVIATYSTCFGVGAASYIVAGQSVLTTEANSNNNQSFVLSQGGAGRSATFMLKDSSVVNVRGTSDVDSNQASIMFGHWNGPSTFTIQDEAAFNAVAQVLVGKTSNDHTININGGTFTARGIKASASASGTNRLNLNGGLLVLGDVGITSYGSTTIGVNVSANSEIRASAATLPISQAMTLGANTTLAFTKANDVSAATVSLTGAVSGSGGISAGAGITLNVGTNRPEGEISIDADGALAVVMASKADVPVLKVSSQPAHVVLYDTDGETVLTGASVDYDAVAGTIAVKPPVNTWNVSENLSFDTDANWSYGLPQSTQDIAIKVTGDATLTIDGTYSAASLTVSGSGVVVFSGEGSLTVDTLYLTDGATLEPKSKVLASTSIVLGAGTVLRLRDKTESTPISGEGAVETYGSVKFAGNNTFTGGLTVTLGSIARTTAQQGFGKNNWGQDIAYLSRIVVRDGGSLDLANTKDACYAITIAGKGVIYNGVYMGAIFNSGPQIGDNSRQTASLTLSADAMVRAEASTNGWGIVNSGHAASVLALNGHTLTVSGAGYFPIVNANTGGSTTTGTLVADGVTLGLVEVASNLTGVDVIAKGCATIKIAVTPTALGSLTVKPSNAGTTASNWNLPSGFVPKVDTSNVDTTALSSGDTVTLLTVPSGVTLADTNISVRASGRFETAIYDHAVTATLKAGMPSNFLHYEFDNSVAAASDSGTSFNVDGEAGSPAFVGSKNGHAVRVRTGYTPYWGTYANGTSPFHAGAVTATTVAKLCETNIILWGIGTGGCRTGLIVNDAHTVQVVSEAYLAPVLVELTTTADLTKGWHFYAVVATEFGVTLYVDDVSVSADRGFPRILGQQGQLGSFHGGAYIAKKVSASGYYLDDWRVYDTVLTRAEVKTVKREVCPDPLFIRLR